ncbi:MAG: radical SAM protein [Dehalococcoidia bacterium]|nr:radical SAM protein [Dehalococcoidia bacterium]
MLSVSRLLNGTVTPGDALRYGRRTSRVPAHMLHFSVDKKPVVVWNVTRRCNLRCVHCYADAGGKSLPDELTAAEGLRLIDDLAAFGVPTILFSGGEPLTRDDLFPLVAHAVAKGIRCVLSTNGTLITPDTAADIRRAGFSYVGVSLDGMAATNDRIRGKKGAFDEALRGARYCRDAGVRVGLRFTVHAMNIDDLPPLLDLLEEEDFPRLCVYHLAFSGRGRRMQRFSLEPQQTRAVVDQVFERSDRLHRRGIEKDILTVDNHADNAYLYMRLAGEQPERAGDVYKMLRWNGGNQSGIAISCVDPAGHVHADQFSWHYSLGQVRERSFSDIWSGRGDPVLTILKDRKRYLKGRCRVCRWLDICNGNLRVRAERYFKNLLAPDPGCYLTDEEIGITPGTPEAEEAARWPVPVQNGGHPS